MNEHLHHILAKLGRKHYTDRILALQKILYFEHGIDPIMGVDIFVYSPMKGVHSNKAMLNVIKEMEKFFKTTRRSEEVVKFLKNLGRRAAEGEFDK